MTRAASDHGRSAPTMASLALEIPIDNTAPSRGPPRSALPDCSYPDAAAPESQLAQGPPAPYPQPDSSLLPLWAEHPQLSNHLLSSYISAHPTHTVRKAIKTLYPLPNPIVRAVRRFRVKHSVIAGMTDAEMKYWEAQGPDLRRKAGWKLPGEAGPGAEVSELFWKVRSRSSKLM